MRAVAVPGLNSQQSIECILEGALIFHRIGLKKKYGFFLYIAALLSAENDNYSVAHALVCYSSNVYTFISIINCNDYFDRFNIHVMSLVYTLELKTLHQQH